MGSCKVRAHASSAALRDVALKSMDALSLSRSSFASMSRSSFHRLATISVVAVVASPAVAAIEVHDRLRLLRVEDISYFFCGCKCHSMGAWDRSEKQHGGCCVRIDS